MTMCFIRERICGRCWVRFERRRVPLRPEIQRHREDCQSPNPWKDQKRKTSKLRRINKSTTAAARRGGEYNFRWIKGIITYFGRNPARHGVQTIQVECLAIRHAQEYGSENGVELLACKRKAKSHQHLAKGPGAGKGNIVWMSYFLGGPVCR